MRFRLEGDLDQIVAPPAGEGRRTDELWRSTCFEAFFGEEGEPGYCELNLAPSEDWAAYAFSGYRAGMRLLEVEVLPRIQVWRADDVLQLEAEVTPGVGVLASRKVWRVGLAAVIETIDGARSYWALTHTPGKPDFHIPAAHIGRLHPGEQS